MNKNPLPADFTPDMSLLRPLEPSRQLGEPHLVHYHRDNKDLYYVGTHHGTDIENKSHEIIGQAILKHQPQLIIVEGIETEKGMAPSLGFNPKSARDRNRFFRHSSEGVHAAEFARARGIPFVGGEPSPDIIFGGLEGSGYTTKEVMALYLLRTIPILKRENLLETGGNFEKQASDYLSKGEVFKHIPQELRLTYAEFKDIYEQHKAELGNKDFLEVTAQDSNPNPGSNANYFQRMSNVMDAIRDQHLVHLIGAAYNANDSVLVIYGNAHQYKSRPVFEEMFKDKGRIEQLVPVQHSSHLQTGPDTQIDPLVEANVQIQSQDTNMKKAALVIKYAALAVLAAGAVALVVGAASVVSLSLLAAGAAAMAGGTALSLASKKSGAEYETPTQQAREPFITANFQPSVEHVMRKDGKSWAAAIAKPAEQHQHRAL